jgi:hypothetical protein
MVLASIIIVMSSVEADQQMYLLSLIQRLYDDSNIKRALAQVLFGTIVYQHDKLRPMYI